MAVSTHENLTRSTANYVKSNQTQNFTTNLSINRNIHDAEKLLFTHTPGSMNSFRKKNYFLLPDNPVYTSAIRGQDIHTLMAPYSLVNQCLKKHASY